MFVYLLEDPKFWILICFILFVILMIKPFRQFMIGGIDSKIDEIKKNLNTSIQGFSEAEENLKKSIEETKDLDSKINGLINNSHEQAKIMTEVSIEKTKASIANKERNSIERINQIELSTIQLIKNQTSRKLSGIITNYFSEMNEDNKKKFLEGKIKELNNIT